MTTETFDYLAAENAIVQRVAEALPGFAVEVALTADNIVAKGRTKPTALVLFDGDKLLDSLEDGTSLVEQRWGVYLVLRGPKAQRDSGNIATGVESDGKALFTLLHALAGFKPGKGLTPLERATGVAADYVDGARLYGVAFSTQLVVPAA